jgi:hypothetical protein
VRREDIHRTEQERLDLIANLFWAEFLKEAGEEITRVVDQNVDSAKLRDGGLNGRLRLRACHVKFDGQRLSWPPTAEATFVASRPVATTRARS